MKVSRILFFFAAIVAVGMGLVHIRAETQQAGFTIGQLQAKQRQMKRSCLQLQMEVAQLRNPTRLTAENTRMALDLQPPTTVAEPKGYALAKSGH